MGQDFRKRLTDRLVSFMEENGAMPWQQGWSAVNLRPFNPGTGAKYRGGNVLSLLVGAVERGSDDPRWMTLKQANAAGYSIRKGAKGNLVEYWDWGQPKEQKPAPEAGAAPQEGDLERVLDEAAADGGQAQRRKPLVFYAVVFNGADIVGLPEVKKDTTWSPNELVERLIKASGARIEHKALSRSAGGRLLGNAAYFDAKPEADCIVVPPREQFKSAGDYYATVLHELAHWSGGKARLDRGLGKAAHGSPEYAREELRAEIAAMFMTAMMGLEGQVQNHASYTAHWVQVLKGDKHEVFRAAKDAEAIVDYLFEFDPELRALVDGRLEANLLPKERPARHRDSGIQDIPSFAPPRPVEPLAPAVPEGVGRSDSRWPAFEATVKIEAGKYGVSDETVEQAFKLLEDQFTPLLAAAERNGYTVDDMQSMLVRRLVEEMRANREREAKWAHFAGQVRTAAVGVLSAEQVELELQKLGQRYQQLLQVAGQENWDKARTDQAVRDLVFGEKGRRPITADFVRDRFGDDASLDADDDLILRPLGLATIVATDATPADASAMPDERIGASRHADVQESMAISP